MTIATVKLIWAIVSQTENRDKENTAQTRRHADTQTHGHLSEHIAKSLPAVTEMHTEPVVVFAALPIPDLGSVCVGGVIFHHEREAVAVAKHVVVGGVMLCILPIM